MYSASAYESLGVRKSLGLKSAITVCRNLLCCIETERDFHVHCREQFLQNIVEKAFIKKFKLKCLT